MTAVPRALQSPRHAVREAKGGKPSAPRLLALCASIGWLICGLVFNLEGFGIPSFVHWRPMVFIAFLVVNAFAAATVVAEFIVVAHPAWSRWRVILLQAIAGALLVLSVLVYIEFMESHAVTARAAEPHTGDRMAKLIALYRTPTDPEAFDQHYFSRHVPLAKKIPGLRSYEVSQGAIATPTGQAQYHLIDMMDFATFADIQAALASPEGEAAGADLANFADGGVDLLVFDSREV